MSDNDTQQEDTFGLRYNQADIDKLAKIRQDYRDRCTSQPVFNAARATYDLAEASQQQGSSSSVVPLTRHAAKEAMEALKNNLKSLRSNKLQQQAAVSNATTPVAPGEIRIRANVAADYINSKVGSDANNSYNTANKTSLGVEVRPLNASAFETARAALLKNTGVPVANPADEEQLAVLSAKIVFDIDLFGHPDAAKILESGSALLPQVVDLIKEDEDEMNLNAQVVDHPTQPGKKQLVLAVAGFQTDDPFGELFGAVADKALSQRERRRNWKPKEERIAAGSNAAVDVLRLLSVKAELPHDINTWFATEENRSVMSLLEGARVGVEAIVRDDSKNSIAATVARELLSDFSKEDLIEKITKILLFSISREVNVDLKSTPFEYIFASAVRDGGRAFRAMLVDKFSKDRYQSQEDLCIDKFNQTLNSSFPEEAIAGLASYLIPVVGITPNLARLAVFPRLARSVIDNYEVPDLCDMISIGLNSKNILGDFVSAEFVTPSTNIKITGSGISGKALRDAKWLPDNFADMVAKFKPIARAGNQTFDEKDPESVSKFLTKDQEADLEDCRAVNTPSFDLFPKDWWRSEFQTIVTDLPQFQHSELPLCAWWNEPDAPWKLLQKPAAKIDGPEAEKSSWNFGEGSLPKELVHYEKREFVEPENDSDDE